MIKTNPGLIKSPQDKRDVLTSKISPEVKRYPKEYPMPFDLTVLDQKSTPHCVGFACAGLKQDKELREKVSKIFDGHWIYKECKKIDNYDGDGTFLRAGMKVLQKTGAKPKSETNSSPYKIGEYAQVDDISFEGIKKNIFLHGPILAGFYGSNEGWKETHVRPPKSGENKWGHAVMLVGWGDNHIIGKNSWGKDWGAGGYFYFDASYLPFEAWAIVIDAPNIKQSNQGYVAQKYLTSENFVIGQKVSPTTNLNMRTEPGGEIITTLKNGTKLNVLSQPVQSGKYNWIKVNINLNQK